ncbi:MAG: hypothetical protein JW934_02960 [Anaerolineae bacterium]|nr:hypothetical protein [Anaerolineae bacterium]
MLEIVNQQIATTHQPRWEQWLWQWCLAKRTPLVLFALIILGLIASQVIPQIPGGTLTKPTDYDQWLQTIPILFRDAESMFNGLDLFDIQRAVWFQSLLAIAMAVSMVALGHNLYSFIRPSHALLHRSSKTNDASWGLPAQTALGSIVQTVTALVGSPRQAKVGNRVIVYGTRPRWTQSLVALAHLGLLLAVCGIVLDAGRGWGERALTLPPEAAIEITSGQTLALESFDPARSQATLQIEQGTRRSQATAGASGTTLVNGLGYRVTGIGGLHVQIQAVDEMDTRLNLYPYIASPEPAQALDYLIGVEQNEIAFIIPTQNLIARLTWIDRAALQLTLSDGAGQRLAEHVLPLTSTTLPIDSIRLLVDATVYPTLAVSYHPGRWALLGGTLLVIVGSLFSVIPVQTVWAEIALEQDRVAVQIRQVTHSKSAAQRAEAAFQALRAQIASPDPAEG